jgi:DNA-binding CsgD family transcriptional regulator
LSLSNIQRDMIGMISIGLKQKEIADKKRISISTVEKTLYNLRQKFSAQSNSDLIRILNEKGLL